MRRIFLVLVIIVNSLHSFSQQQHYSPKDIAALEFVTQQWQHFSNIHNMDSMGTMLRDDIDFVNVAGLWLKGKEEAVRDHKQKHEAIVFKIAYGRQTQLL